MQIPNKNLSSFDVSKSQFVEPELPIIIYQVRECLSAGTGNWSEWKDCSKQAAEIHKRVPVMCGWESEIRKLLCFHVVNIVDL